MVQEAVKGTDAAILRWKLFNDGGKPTVEKDDKLEKLKMKCTAHEKKLLGGVINPSISTPLLRMSERHPRRLKP